MKNNMRSFLIQSGLIICLIILAIMVSGIGLILYSPFHPGNIMFPLQNMAEQMRLFLFRSPIDREAYILDLVERRIDDLTYRIGTRYELISLQYLDKSLDQAFAEVPSIEENSRNEFMSRFFSLTLRIDQVLKVLINVPINNPEQYHEFKARILALIQMAKTSGLLIPGLDLASPININNPNNSIESTPTSIESAGLIPFPPGSAGAVHAFYPLVGKHSSIACTDCHITQSYSTTSNLCVSCHILERPSPHYYGQCGICHSPVSWSDISFDHSTTNTSNCFSCHVNDAPQNHYSGQCSACHVVQAWNIVTFNHLVARAVDCISCHENIKPLNHYSGQCSNCHNTVNWKSVDFNHTGFENCSSCHSSDSPPDHYLGQCSKCHSTSTWRDAVFDHTGFTDCISCHSSDAPPAHYNGQCSNCHSTSTWLGAVFDHAGLTDCISCHDGDAPANHYPGQCSNCHNPNSSWRDATFNHSGYTDCLGCHSGDAPGDHFPGQCSDCHSTDNWKGAVIDHSNLTDCISCHIENRPKEHDPGQCSECHSYPHWGD